MSLFSKLECNFDTGILTWKESPNRRIKVGSKAGKILNGYIYVRYEGVDYPATKIIWYLKYGKFPEKMLDHINGNPLDNRIINLRDISDSENKQNTHKAKGFYKRGNKYCVVVKLNNKVVFRESCDSEELASSCYHEAKKIYHPYYAKEL